MGIEHIGERIRELRQRAGISTRDLAKRVGVSSGFISLLERGKSSASLSTLRNIAGALGQPLAAFFDEGDGANDTGDELNGAEIHMKGPAAQVVRRRQRKRLEIPGSHFKFELLSPDLQGTVEFILIELEPGHPPSVPRSHIRSGEECAVVLQGTMRLTVGDQTWVLESGDSVRFDPSIPHQIENVGDCKLVQISAIVPPSF